jgi:hypothetical protein
MGVFFWTQKRKHRAGSSRQRQGKLKLERLEERTVPSAYSDTVLGDGAIGYWRLGESDSSLPAANAADPSGATDGTYLGNVTVGMPGALAGDPDTAAGFDGITAFVDIPSTNGGPFDLSNNFTLEAWVINMGRGPEGDPVARIFSNGYPGNRGIGWGILPNDGVRFTTYGILDYDSSVTVVPEDGAWHYVAVTLDSTNAATFFVDGFQTDFIPGALPARTSEFDLQIGNNPFGVQEHFNGCIDEPAIYPSVLTNGQIQNHYNIGITGGPAPHGHGTTLQTLGHNLGQLAVPDLTLQGPAQVGSGSIAATTTGLQQVQPASVDQLSRSIPTSTVNQVVASTNTGAQLAGLAQHDQADPFAIQMSL